MLRYGNSSALTTKPAWSSTSTASLPHATTKARTALIVSGAAMSGRTTSTRRIAGAGLKKCTPQTRSGRDVSIASSTPTGSRCWSPGSRRGGSRGRAPRRAPASTARSSTTDSITRSQPAEVLQARRWSVTRESTPRRRPAVRFSARPGGRGIFSRAASELLGGGLRPAAHDHVAPALAQTSAMPLAIVPDPTTPTSGISSRYLTGHRRRGPGARLRTWSARHRRRLDSPPRREVLARRRGRRSAPGADVVVVPTAAAFTGAAPAAVAAAEALATSTCESRRVMVTDRAGAAEPALRPASRAADLVVLTDGSALHARSVLARHARGRPRSTPRAS